MRLDIRAKLKPMDVFQLEVMDFETDYEVYIDDKRAPKLIEEALLFFLNAKGEEYVTAILKEAERLGIRK